MATQNSESTVAINEHALAAGEFAQAAQSTSSVEALRTLRLLEDHHRKLSELLKAPQDVQVVPVIGNQEVQAEVEKPVSTSAAVAEVRATKATLGTQPAYGRTPPSLNSPRRPPSREPSSSIISNLASARNIRSRHTRQPLSPSVSSLQAPGSLEVRSRADATKVNIPTAISEDGRAPGPQFVNQNSQIKSRTRGPLKPSTQGLEIAAGKADDEGFSKFYHTFENILWKLSAPLAFAGLPLATDDKASSHKPENDQVARSSAREHVGSEPDLARYISRAALQASNRDGQGGTDSFYVVPSTGGTVSYARIASIGDKDKRWPQGPSKIDGFGTSSDHHDEDDFVDARETPLPRSPAYSRQSSLKMPNEAQLENRLEELGLENRSLKGNIDKLSKRLALFEMSAQKSGSMLQESVRLMRTASPSRQMSFDDGLGKMAADEATRTKLIDLEERLSSSNKAVEDLGKENEKLKSVITRYRERWEKLKEGAKTRRDANSVKESSVAQEPESKASNGRDAPRDRYLAG